MKTMASQIAQSPLGLGTAHTNPRFPNAQPSSPLPLAQAALATAQQSKDPSHTPWTTKLSGKFGELSNKINEIAVEGSKNSFRDCLRTGFSSVERLKGENWGMKNPLNI